MTMNKTPCGESAFTAIPEAIAAYRRGDMLVVLDDERRENEGDLIMAAEFVTPEAVNFMVKHGGGLHCLAMPGEMLARLGLSRMAPGHGRDSYRTAFMESVDAAEGVTTGISAADRAKTVAVLIDPQSRPEDLIRPGHLFPLESVPYGVLRRPGHTEAAVDMARLAGLKPAGLICEILNEDGSMARRDQLLAFAQRHGLPIMTIADLIVYRRNHEKLVEKEQTIRLPTDAGVFQMHLYKVLPEDEHHLALVMGTPSAEKPCLVRMHSECLTGDVFGSMRCDCGTQLRRSMELVAQEGNGVVIYLRQEGRGIGLAHKIHAYALQESGRDTVEANLDLGFDADLRDYHAAAQMLHDLGIHRVRLITNNPNKVSGLEKYGIEVTERVSLVIPPTEHNERYLNTKKTKMGHLL
jgi:3,4-dihydroxy 2-butanone 4-phosphate synthase/GTP cyclohydrolase II